MHYLQQMVDYIQQKYIDTSLNDYDSLINLIDLNFKHLIVFDWFDFDDWRIDSCIRAWITSLIHSFAHVTPISALKGTTNAMANHFHVVNVQGVVNRIRLSIAKVLWYTGAAWEATNGLLWMAFLYVVSGNLFENKGVNESNEICSKNFQRCKFWLTAHRHSLPTKYIRYRTTH